METRKFFVRIRAYGYYTEFEVMAEDSAESIENAIVDKIRKNDIKFVSDTFCDPKKCCVTYEEVDNDGDKRPHKGSLHQEEISRPTVGAGV